MLANAQNIKRISRVRITYDGKSRIAGLARGDVRPFAKTTASALTQVYSDAHMGTTCRLLHVFAGQKAAMPGMRPAMLS